jgi:hypothetical protein
LEGVLLSGNAKQISAKKTFLDESRGLDSEDSLLGISFNSSGMLQLVSFSDQIRLPSFHMIVTFLHVRTSVVWLFEFIKKIADHNY